MCGSTSSTRVAALAVVARGQLAARRGVQRGRGRGGDARREEAVGPELVAGAAKLDQAGRERARAGHITAIDHGAMLTRGVAASVGSARPASASAAAGTRGIGGATQAAERAGTVEVRDSDGDRSASHEHSHPADP